MDDEQPGAEPGIHHLDDAQTWTTDEPVGQPAEPARPAGSSLRRFAPAAGLVLVGALVGTVGVSAVQAGTHDSAQTSAVADQRQGGFGGPGQQGTLPQGTAPQGTAPQGTDPQSGQFGPPGGGLDGEQRLQGVVTAVGSSSLTVRTSSGTATYAVDARTDIRKDGSTVALSAIKAGDAVLVHVYPSGSTLVAERVLAGTSATAGPGGFGDRGGPGGPPPGTSGGTGSSTGTTSKT